MNDTVLMFLHFWPRFCINPIMLKVGRFFVRSLLTRTASDSGQLFTIINCRVWKETVTLGLLFTFILVGPCFSLSISTSFDRIGVHECQQWLCVYYILCTGTRRFRNASFFMKDTCKDNF